MKKYLRFIVICAVVSALSAGLGAYAATNFGSESDPLITLSYLEQVLEPELKQAYDAQTKEAIAQLEQRLKEKDDSLFCPVTVPAGTVMHCGRGDGAHGSSLVSGGGGECHADRGGGDYPYGTRRLCAAGSHGGQYRRIKECTCS